MRFAKERDNSRPSIQQVLPFLFLVLTDFGCDLGCDLIRGAEFRLVKLVKEAIQ